MPTYEYACPKCGHEFELFQSMLDEPLKKCPKCKKTGVKRLVGGGAGLIFKGTGFYITDYKTKKGTPHKDGGSDSKASSSESKTSDSKPATSTPSTPAAPAAPVKASKSASK
ncbi:MAG: zinc ribbon domain-containing protein [Opitutaceae bacterium]|nr:zinc ribbon domain-containing protein [Opitutaceae bacterium]